MLLEKGHDTDLLPCAGITLIRFYGYNLRSPWQDRFRSPGKTPRETLKLTKLTRCKNWL